MNVLQLITRQQFRGAEVFALNLTEFLRDKGNVVIIAAILPPINKDFGVQFNPIDILSDNKIFGFKALKQLARLVSERDIAIVQANASITLKYAVLSRLLFRWEVPIVYRNASIASSWIKGPVHKAYNKWLLNQVDRIACVSERSRDDLVYFFSIPLETTVVIENGTSVPPFNQKSKNAKINLLHIGAFTPEKNHEMLIRVFNELCLERDDLTLTLAGSGSLEANIKNMTVQMNLSSKVEFKGSVTDVGSLMRNADLVLLTSKVEGLPGVLIEAGANGVPFVSTDVGSIRDLVPDDYQQFVVPLHDEGRFVTECRKLLNNSILTEKYGAALYYRIKERFSIDQIGGQFVELYYQVLEK